jgi:hypothetical protein
MTPTLFHEGTDADWKAACTCIEIEASFFREPMTCDHLKFLNAHESEIDALHILQVKIVCWELSAAYKKSIKIYRTIKLY